LQVPIPLYKKVLSYLIPISIEKTIGKNLTVLQIQVYCNQLMLVTPRAIYSYGIKYNPFRKSFAYIKNDISQINSFLLLGTGLGSALKILQDKYHQFPSSILVDNDEDILNLSIKYMDLNRRKNVNWVCDDAVNFLRNNTKRFDLIGIDIFRDLVQPEFTYSKSFVELCNETLTPQGICVFNMILNDDNKIVEIESLLKLHFKKVKFLIDGVNTYFIAYASS